MAPASFFESVVETETWSEDSLTGTYLPTDHARSPWHPEHQHAGPAAALLVRCLEQVHLPTTDPLTNRISLDILAPLPMAAVAVSVRILRAGWLASLVVAEMTPASSDEPVLRLTAWRTRRVPVTLPRDRGPYRSPPAGRTPSGPPPTWTSGYARALDWAVAEGSLDTAGPATAWLTPRVALVDGQPASGAALVVLLADAATAISTMADPDHLRFVNTDLSVHLVREPVGDSIWLASESFLDPDGIGLVTSVMGDETGAVAVGSQALFLADPRELTGST